MVWVLGKSIRLRDGEVTEHSAETFSVVWLLLGKPLNLQSLKTFLWWSCCVCNGYMLLHKGKLHLFSDCQVPMAPAPAMGVVAGAEQQSTCGHEHALLVAAAVYGCQQLEGAPEKVWARVVQKGPDTYRPVPIAGEFSRGWAELCHSSYTWGLFHGILPTGARSDMGRAATQPAESGGCSVLLLLHHHCKIGLSGLQEQCFYWALLDVETCILFWKSAWES